MGLPVKTFRKWLRFDIDSTGVFLLWAECIFSVLIVYDHFKYSHFMLNDPPRFSLKYQNSLSKCVVYRAV